MKLKTLLGAVILTIFIAGCDPDNPGPPAVDADFSVTGYEQTAPATLNFINTSKNASSYVWNFGDGNTSTSTQPQHTYNLAGTYQVKLKATGANGSDSICKIVNIEPPVTANRSAFTYFLDKCTGYPVGAAFKTLNPASQNVVWDFNGVPNVSRDPIIQFIVPGDYTIKHSSVINNVRDTVIRIIRID
jgi:PKD repeat protein